mgnify:FL=1|jgi:hypothetical protein
MQIIVSKQGITFIGKVKDLPRFLADYPGETTLEEFIRYHLN